MIQRSAGHGKHLPVVELALRLGLTFEVQILLLGER